MKLTNRHGLPKALVKAADLILGRERPLLGFSVTEVIRPPQMVQLERRHPDYEVDVADVLWLLLGSAVHTVIARAAMKDQERELRTMVPIALFKQAEEQLSGTFDLAEDSVIIDWKVTSVWSYLRARKEGKSEWERQLNLYSYLARKTGAFEPKGLSVYAILKDWSGPEAARNPDMPPVPFARLDFPQWSFEDQEAYAAERLGLHVQAVHLPELDLPECTPEERWEKPPVWAIMKPGRKRARVLCESEEEMKAKLQSEETAVFRRGSSQRCELYCAVGRAGLCRQARAFKSLELEGVS